MFVGYFTERPYQDAASGFFGATGRPIQDLGISNGAYDPILGSKLYNRYFDEKIYAEQQGFDGLMLNEHHSTPICMGGVMNVEADFCQIEPQEVDLYRIVAEFVLDLGVFDAGVELFEVLGSYFTTEDTESTEEKNQMWPSCECISERGYTVERINCAHISACSVFLLFTAGGADFG